MTSSIIYDPRRPGGSKWGVVERHSSGVRIKGFRTQADLFEYVGLDHGDDNVGYIPTADDLILMNHRLKEAGL